MRINRVNILGTEYNISIRNKNKDSILKECDGYCDKTLKVIVISEKEKDCNLGDFKVYQDKVLRHEIVHAFLFESGLHENFNYDSETVIDWVAVQFPKMIKIFQKVGCI